MTTPTEAARIARAIVENDMGDQFTVRIRLRNSASGSSHLNSIAIQKAKRYGLPESSGLFDEPQYTVTWHDNPK